LTRIDGGRQRTVIDLDLTLPQDRDAKLETGDVLRVFPIRPTLENAVALEGHVFRTGPSQYRPGLRLSDVIGSPDELRPNADLGYVLIRRENGPGRTIEVLLALHSARREAKQIRCCRLAIVSSFSTAKGGVSVLSSRFCWTCSDRALQMYQYRP
jgi:hypothetical protein